MKKRIWLYCLGTLTGILILTGLSSTLQAAPGSPQDGTQGGQPPARSYTAPNVTITEFPLPTPYSSHGSITTGPDGNLWFTEYSAIGRITTSGIITEFPLPTPYSSHGSITTGPDGNLWFTENDFGTDAAIGRISTTGVYTYFVVPDVTLGLGGITSGWDGNLWFTENITYTDSGIDAAIGRVSTTGVYTYFVVPDVTRSLGGITRGSDGNLWFVESRGEKIRRITPAGAITEYQLPACSFGNLKDITSGPDGNLWFTEEANIGRIRPSDGLISEFDVGWGGGCERKDSPNGSPGLSLITSGPDGNLWFTEWRYPQIGRMTTAGVWNGNIYTEAGAASGITSGPDGNLWFTVGNSIMRVSDLPLPSSTPTPTPPPGPCNLNTSAAGQGDDVYTLSVPSNCTDITGTLNISRFYGPLTNPNAITGTISTTALSVTVAPTAILEIDYSGIQDGERVRVDFAGASHLLPPSDVELNLPYPIDTTSLILPNKGHYDHDPNICPHGTDNCISLTSRVPDALNPITITNPSAHGRIFGIRLKLEGMRPLVLAGGIDINETHPAHYMSSTEDPNNIQNDYFSWMPDPDPLHGWNTATLSMVFRPYKDSHASIVDGGRYLGNEISVAKDVYGVSKVNILGHSLGGLWAREFAWNNRNSVDKLMMLGTPNAGSFLADAAKAFVEFVCHFGDPACSSAVYQYDLRSPALFDLTSDFLNNQYNPYRGQVPGVTYLDLAGETLSHDHRTVALLDGAVFVNSVQALPYSTPLAPIAEEEGDGIPNGLVHLQENRYPPLFRNAFAQYFGMGDNNYSTTGMRNTQSRITAPLDVTTSTARYPAFVGTVQSGQTQTSTIMVDNATSVSFNLGWFNYSSTLGLTLHDPQGTVITPTSVYSGSSYLNALNGGEYIVTNPLTGTWQVDVQGQTVAGTSQLFYVSGELAGGVQITPHVASIASPGQPVVVTATLADGALINGAIVTATVSLPLRSTWNSTQFQLAPQGNGVYQGSFTPTMTGTHEIAIYALGVNSPGQSFSRTQSVEFTVSSGAALTGGFTESAYDTDSNGLYNNLVISATAVISEAGVYKLGGYLTKADGTMIAYGSGTYTPTVGTVALPLVFDGAEIGQSQADGPYQLRNLYFSRVVSEELGLALVPIAYTTSAYSRYNWERGNIAISGTATEHGVDTNANGLYDYLEVSIPIDVGVAGVYSASLNLIAPDSSVVATSVARSLNFTQGANTLVMRFVGADIRASGVNGPYSVQNLSVWNAAQQTTYIDSVLPQTQSYRSLDFDGPVLVGHVNWQGRPSQPNILQQVPITLTLKTGSAETNYLNKTTDPAGSFTVSVGSLITGTYSWRVKNPKYLANSGTVTLTGTTTTNVEMGLMRAGDANNDNLITVLDFNILKPAFGRECGDPAYDDRADFTGDCLVTVTDFNLLKNNFGQGGSPPIQPR